MNMFAAPLLRELGSRLEYIILIGFPLIGVKLSSSRALAATIKEKALQSQLQKKALQKNKPKKTYSSVRSTRLKVKSRSTRPIFSCSSL
jgi:hypothetical protein